MKKLYWIIGLVLTMSFASCQDKEELVDYASVMMGESVGFNPFTTGNVRLCVDDHRMISNQGNDVVEFAFVKDYVYKIQQINKIPTHGWKETVKCDVQDGFVGRLLLPDGSYEYCRFYAYSYNYDNDANQYALFKYQSNFKP